MVRHLEHTVASLDATGEAAGFEVFLLSDTRVPEIAAAEEALFRRWRSRALCPDRLHYRRRATNEGHKTGNLWDFLERHGERFDHMVVLDADSVMSGAAISGSSGYGGAPRDRHPAAAHRRPAQPQPVPADLPVRHAARHARLHGRQRVVAGRLRPLLGPQRGDPRGPFMAHCRLPTLPGKPPLGGRVLSHDQVEAVLMRRAGWQVRVVADEDGSFEENPPTSPTSSSATCAGAKATGIRPPRQFGCTRWAAPALARHPDVRVRAGLDAVRPRGLRPRDRGRRVAAVRRPNRQRSPCCARRLGRLGSARGDDGARLRAQASPGSRRCFCSPASAGLRRRRGGRRLHPGRAAVLLRPRPDHGGRADDLRARHDRRADDPAAQLRDTRNLPWREALHGLWPQTLFGFALGAAVWLLAPDGARLWAVLFCGPRARDALRGRDLVGTAGHWRGSGSAPRRRSTRRRSSSRSRPRSRGLAGDGSASRGG